MFALSSIHLSIRRQASYTFQAHRYCWISHLSEARYLRFSKRQYSGVAPMPRIRAVNEDDSVKDIPEKDLYKYTRHRWLYNEESQLSGRYLKFDLDQLLKAAITAINKPTALYCKEVLKCKEGLNNKVLLLTMNDGSEIIAKLPTPSAGPPSLTTASDVATREFLRDAMGVPVPRVISWSADNNNAIGAEFILEEKAPGHPLSKFWGDWNTFPMESRAKIIGQVVNIERKLAEVSFEKSGCIYFNHTPGSDTLRTSHPVNSSILQRFKMGPLLKKGMWVGAKAQIEMDRGPYSKPLDFIKALAENEIKFLRSYACPRMNYARSLTEPESPEDMINLLKRYLQLSQAMVPSSNPVDTLSPVLWHPDLHLNNIFIDPNTIDITCIVDWQGVGALPLFYQCGVPAMCKHFKPLAMDLTTWPTRPGNFDTLSQDEKDWTDNVIRSEVLHKYYLKITQRNNPRHWNAMLRQNKSQTRPVDVVSMVWEDRDISLLRRLLIDIINQWDQLCPNQGPCPVSFDTTELELHRQEEENRLFIVEVLNNFRTKWGLPTDGMVESAKFEETKLELAKMRTLTVANAGEEAFLADLLWPYQDKSKTQIGILD